MYLLRTIGERWAAHFVAFCALVVLAPVGSSAQNLIANPSFELTDTCPTTLGFWAGDRPLYWYSWQNTSDYFNACAQTTDGIDTIAGVPKNIFGYQPAKEGNAYCGFWACGSEDEYREYIGTQLLQPMVIGENYAVSFWANVAESPFQTSGGCNNVGVLFTMGSNAWTATDPFTGPPFSLRNYAHVYTSEILMDTVGWTLVSGTFTADSAYNYMVMGNFFGNVNTEVQSFTPGPFYAAYIYVDQVCVSAGPGCEANGITEIDAPLMPHIFLEPGSGDVIAGWKDHPQFIMEFLDISGRVVGRPVTGGWQRSVSTSGWSSGVYVARFEDQASRMFVKFVIPR